MVSQTRTLHSLSSAAFFLRVALDDIDQSSSSWPRCRCFNFSQLAQLFHVSMMRLGDAVPVEQIGARRRISRFSNPLKRASVLMRTFLSRKVKKIPGVRLCIAT